MIEHTVEELIRQREYVLCLGYEDLNDQDDLRQDPLMAVLVGKSDPTGQSRADRLASDCPYHRVIAQAWHNLLAWLPPLGTLPPLDSPPRRA